jgi:hypothetical protein
MPGILSQREFRNEGPGRVSGPQAALSGSNPKAPGFAGGCLLCDSPKGLLELDLKTGALKTLATHDRAERLIFCSNVVAAPWSRSRRGNVKPSSNPDGARVGHGHLARANKG